MSGRCFKGHDLKDSDLYCPECGSLRRGTRLDQVVGDEADAMESPDSYTEPSSTAREPASQRLFAQHYDSYTEPSSTAREPLESDTPSPGRGPDRQGENPSQPREQDNAYIFILLAMGLFFAYVGFMLLTRVLVVVDGTICGTPIANEGWESMGHLPTDLGDPPCLSSLRWRTFFAWTLLFTGLSMMVGLLWDSMRRNLSPRPERQSMTWR